VALTHDYSGGELNVSLVNVRHYTSNRDYVVCVEKCIRALSADNMDKEQTFMATSQVNRKIEDDFAITNEITPMQFIRFAIN